MNGKRWGNPPLDAHLGVMCIRLWDEFIWQGGLGCVGGLYESRKVLGKGKFGGGKLWQREKMVCINSENI